METTNAIEQQRVAGNGDRSKVKGGDVGDSCYEAIIEHWIKARIDGPVEAIARYDDAAKQLITIGGLMQAGLAAVYSLLIRQPMNKWQMGAVILFEASLLVSLSAAAWVCSLQPELNVRSISHLLKRIIAQPRAENDLLSMVCDWCDEFRSSVKKKRSRMLVAKISFIVCCGTISLFLLLPLFS